MTVNHYTPSQEDIEQAPHNLLIIQAQLVNSPILYCSDEMTILDFSHLYTEEEKAIARQHLLAHTLPSCFGNIEFTSHQPYDVAQTKARARFMLGCSPLQPLGESTFVEIRTNYGRQSEKPKDFSPVAIQSVLPVAQLNPNYRVKEVKVINGQKVAFYGQDLSKDK